MIQVVGWRNTYLLCGVIGISASILGLCFIREPPNSVRLQMEAEQIKEA